MEIVCIEIYRRQLDMTSYEKMIHILHNKDFELLEDWVADAYFFDFESQMWTQDEFLERLITNASSHL